MTWPSPFSPGTLGYMKDRIADEIDRDDLTSQIAVAISDAIKYYVGERFRFNESRDTVFNTVAGQEFYDAAGPPAIPILTTMFYVDYITVLIANAQFDVRRQQPEVLELLSQNGTQRGPPEDYSYYNETLRFYPIPDQAYQIRIAAHIDYLPPTADDTTGNRWMTDGERLIRARAKYELAINVTKDADEAQMNSPFEPREGEPAGAAWTAYAELRSETNRLTGRGRISSPQF